MRLSYTERYQAIRAAASPRTAESEAKPGSQAPSTPKAPIEIIDLTADSSDEEGDKDRTRSISCFSSDSSSDVPLIKRRRLVEANTPSTEPTAGPTSNSSTVTTKKNSQAISTSKGARFDPSQPVLPQRPDPCQPFHGEALHRARNSPAPRNSSQDEAKLPSFRKKSVASFLPDVVTPQKVLKDEAEFDQRLAKEKAVELRRSMITLNWEKRYHKKGVQTFEFRRVWGRDSDVDFDFSELSPPSKKNWVLPCSHRWVFGQGIYPHLDQREDCVKELFHQFLAHFKISNWDDLPEGQVLEKGDRLGPPVVDFPLLRQRHRYIDIRFGSKWQHKICRRITLRYRRIPLIYWSTGAFLPSDQLALEYHIPPTMQKLPVTKDLVSKLLMAVVEWYHNYFEPLQLWHVPHGYPDSQEEWCPLPTPESTPTVEEQDDEPPIPGELSKKQASAKKDVFILLVKFRNEGIRERARTNQLYLPGWLAYEPPGEQHRIKVVWHGRPPLCDFCRTSNTNERPRHLEHACEWQACKTCGHKHRKDQGCSVDSLR